MIDARAKREQELVDLIHRDRPRLVAIYCDVTKRKQLDECPDILTCLRLIREIVEVELPLKGT